MKRLADAERDGDKIYAVLRGMGASSDGKGKGITAPNPDRAEACDRTRLGKCRLSPATATLHRRSWHFDAVSAMWSKCRAWRTCSSSFTLPLQLSGARLSQVEYRTSEGRGGSGRTAENSSGAARQGAAAQRALRASQPRHRFCTLAALCEHGAEALGRPRRTACAAPA